MAFASAISGRSIFGNKRFHWGTYTSSGGSTGGDVDTGLKICDGFWHEPKGSAVATNQGKLNETLPIAGNALTIVTDANEVGYWYAFGY